MGSSFEKSDVWTDVAAWTSSWSYDDNKLVEFFRIYMLLTPLWLVLVLQYLTNSSFIVLSSLVRIHGRALLHICWNQLQIDVCMVIYAPWQSSADTVDFDLFQTFPFPLMS